MVDRSVRGKAALPQEDPCQDEDRGKEDSFVNTPCIAEPAVVYGARRGGRRREVTPLFKKRDRHTSLLATSHFLPEDKRRRLEPDWPGQFRRNALPPIDEEAFRGLDHEWNGRPNPARWSRPDRNRAGPPARPSRR